jgi:2-keto-4-pentenoate hydratase/2-oxohepta-3-ene-1,7-dioic acid hydratase in catechol pathway
VVDLSVRGGAERVAVGKILCVARNYPLHAAESGADVPAAPVFFLKPATAVIGPGDVILLPRQSRRVEAETELAVVLAAGGRNIPKEAAMDHVLGYAVFFDITARDIQAEAKAKGLPWTLAKGFDTFAPLSEVTPRRDVPDPHDLAIRLRINGVLRQDARTAEMVFRVEDLIAWASAHMTLERGDVLATGTPAGVAEIHPGDVLEGTIEDVGRLVVRVAGPTGEDQKAQVGHVP